MPTGVSRFWSISPGLPVCHGFLPVLPVASLEKISDSENTLLAVHNMFFDVWNYSSYWKFPKNIFSAVSRVILKPVYRFGIPNSDPQTLESVDFWHKLSSPFVVAEPWEQCFELFRMQNSQNFPVLCPWTPLRRAYSAPFHQTPQMRNGFSPCYACRKTGTLKKLMSFSRILLIFMNSVFLQN